MNLFHWLGGLDKVLLDIASPPFDLLVLLSNESLRPETEILPGQPLEYPIGVAACLTVFAF
jgi:hypothetical protein